jgi:hypothetical protein
VASVIDEDKRMSAWLVGPHQQDLQAARAGRRHWDSQFFANELGSFGASRQGAKGKRSANATL